MESATEPSGDDDESDDAGDGDGEKGDDGGEGQPRKRAGSSKRRKATSAAM